MKKEKDCRFVKIKFVVLSLGDFDPATGGGF